jgi:hypothetical protein
MLCKFVFAYYVVMLCNYLSLCGYVASWRGVSSLVVRDGLASRYVSVREWCLWGRWGVSFKFWWGG